MYVDSSVLFQCLDKTCTNSNTYPSGTTGVEVPTGGETTAEGEITAGVGFNNGPKRFVSSAGLAWEIWKWILLVMKMITGKKINHTVPNLMPKRRCRNFSFRVICFRRMKWGHNARLQYFSCKIPFLISPFIWFKCSYVGIHILIRKCWPRFHMV